MGFFSAKTPKTVRGVRTRQWTQWTPMVDTGTVSTEPNPPNRFWGFWWGSEVRTNAVRTQQTEWCVSSERCSVHRPTVGANPKEDTTTTDVGAIATTAHNNPAPLDTS